MSISKFIALTIVLATLATDRSVVLAQTSMGGTEAAPYTPPPQQQTAPPPPRFVPVPDNPPDNRGGLLDAKPPQYRPNNAAAGWWGAIAFTADGSYSTVWKVPSEPEAEAAVAKKCAEYGRGACKVVSMSGNECIALSTFNGRAGRNRWNLSFTAGGTTYPDATRAAMNNCNSDERAKGRCVFRVAACADGR